MKLTWLVLVGYAGQALFTMRFVVQWIASERAKKSVFPVAFWFFSMGGGLMTLVYGIAKREFDRLFLLSEDWSYRRVLEQLFQLCTLEEESRPKVFSRLKAVLGLF